MTNQPLKFAFISFPENYKPCDQHTHKKYKIPFPITHVMADTIESAIAIFRQTDKLSRIRVILCDGHTNPIVH